MATIEQLEYLYEEYCDLLMSKTEVSNYLVRLAYLVSSFIAETARSGSQPTNRDMIIQNMKELISHVLADSPELGCIPKLLQIYDKIAELVLKARQEILNQFIEINDLLSGVFAEMSNDSKLGTLLPFYLSLNEVFITSSVVKIENEKNLKKASEMPNEGIIDQSVKLGKQNTVKKTAFENPKNRQADSITDRAFLSFRPALSTMNYPGPSSYNGGASIKPEFFIVPPTPPSNHLSSPGQFLNYTRMSLGPPPKRHFVTFDEPTVERNETGTIPPAEGVATKHRKMPTEAQGHVSPKNYGTGLMDNDPNGNTVRFSESHELVNFSTPGKYEVTEVETNVDGSPDFKRLVKSFEKHEAEGLKMNRIRKCSRMFTLPPIPEEAEGEAMHDASELGQTRNASPVPISVPVSGSAFVVPPAQGGKQASATNETPAGADDRSDVI